MKVAANFLRPRLIRKYNRTLMQSIMKTLLLNPPSFKNFDGGASSRWPATREIESFWYPVWLSYPAGMLPGSRLLDAPSHHITPEQTIEIVRDYEFLVLFTSTVGFANDVAMVRKMKAVKPDLKVGFVGPHEGTRPDAVRCSSAYRLRNTVDIGGIAWRDAVAYVLRISKETDLFGSRYQDTRCLSSCDHVAVGFSTSAEARG